MINPTTDTSFKFILMKAGLPFTKKEQHESESKCIDYEDEVINPF